MTWIGGRRGSYLIAGVVAVAVIALGWAAFARVHAAHMEHRLLTTPADMVAKDKALTRFAVAEARPLFQRNCASCHGADLRGHPAIGAPNLADHVWLYGDGSVFQIERTIMYGIRSGHRKSHDVTEMPAFGLRGQLSETDIDNVVEYVLGLSGRQHNVQAAELGAAVFTGPASCNDCHDTDGRGNSDYGAPDLTVNTWAWGGDQKSLHDSVYYGRHGEMPGWYGKLTLAQIRALSVYVHDASSK